MEQVSKKNNRKTNSVNSGITKNELVNIYLKLSNKETHVFKCFANFLFLFDYLVRLYMIQQKTMIYMCNVFEHEIK